MAPSVGGRSDSLEASPDPGPDRDLAGRRARPRRRRRDGVRAGLGRRGDECRRRRCDVPVGGRRHPPRRGGRAVERAARDRARGGRRARRSTGAPADPGDAVDRLGDRDRRPGRAVVFDAARRRGGHAGRRQAARRGHRPRVLGGDRRAARRASLASLAPVARCHRWCRRGDRRGAGRARRVGDRCTGRAAVLRGAAGARRAGRLATRRHAAAEPSPRAGHGAVRRLVDRSLVARRRARGSPPAAGSAPRGRGRRRRRVRLARVLRARCRARRAEQHRRQHHAGRRARRADRRDPIR